MVVFADQPTISYRQIEDSCVNMVECVCVEYCGVFCDALIFSFGGPTLFITFGVFVQLWFAHTPRLGDTEKKSAEKEAWSRYSQFVDYVSNQITGGHRFINDLVQDVDGSDDNLNIEQD